MEFFREISAITQPIPHSQAAAVLNRTGVYAAHNGFGKAQIWLTFSPDDTQCIQIAWYALGDAFEEKYRNKAPDGSIRFNLIAKKPGKVALYS